MRKTMTRTNDPYRLKYPNSFEESLCGELWVFLRKGFDLRENEGPGFTVYSENQKYDYIFSAYVCRDSHGYALPAGWRTWALQIEGQEKEVLVPLNGEEAFENDLSEAISVLRKMYPSCFLQSALDILVNDAQED
jgi:hypothetical protein